MTGLGFVRSVLLVGTLTTVGSLLATSCLTPEFEFGERSVGLGGGGPDHCTNDVRDGDESDVDCGGSCPACGVDARCRVNGDCTSGVCAGGTCVAPSCDDRIKNGTESDIDCGGSCEPCSIGQGCVIARDCEDPPEDDPALTQCVDETCRLLCPEGSGDCNQTASDGCEVNTLESLKHCGGCGQGCEPANATALCLAGMCLIEACAEGYADLNNDPEDGCEVDTNTDPEHCGPERVKCSSHNGTPGCSDGECTISCNPGFDDCNQDASDGCEVNLDSDSQNCAACGEQCPTGSPSESPYCASGECGLTDCPGGFGDCNGNGECTDPLNTNANCGSCGSACNVANGTGSCSTGSCQIASCNSGFEDCTPASGCETNTQTSPTHCGGCNMTCSTNNVQTPGCTGGSCTPSCSPGWCVGTNPRANGCNVPLGTTSNCSSCGESCSGTTPFCGAGGCQSYLPVVIRNTGTKGGQTLSGSLTLSHALSLGSGNRRVVIVGVSATGNGASDVVSATYNGEAMNKAVTRTHTGEGRYGEASIFYILDADLPSTNGSYNVVVSSTTGWGGLVANVVELSNAQQGPPTHTQTSQRDGTSACQTITHQANVTNPQSFIYAAALAWHQNSSATSTPSGLTAQTHNVFQEHQNHGMMGYRGPENLNRTVGWTAIDSCWDSLLATATFSSATTP